MLLPKPQRISTLDGSFTPCQPLRVLLRADLARRFANHADAISKSWPGRVRMVDATDSDDCPDVRLEIDDRVARPEAYRLLIERSGVRIIAAGMPGLFYGMATLRQIAEVEGDRWSCRSIEDAPDLAIRGLSYDVSRGRVPKIETLFELVDRLAGLKINHLQLYVEHTFDFQFDSAIGEDGSPLTASDITRLDQYCRARFIALVPSLAAFGHMGRILSLPKYRDLAEVPCKASWDDQDWPTRMRGLTIDARNPKSRRLLERMLQEYVSLFSADVVNVNCDEPHDLGSGRNKSVCDRIGRGHLYVEHVSYLAEVCRELGKSIMLWGDVLRSFPERIAEIPDDAILLDWGYEADSDFPGVRRAAAARRQVCVCPGTSGWDRIINAFNVAETNVDRAICEARGHQACGLVMTDWGDQGHFNMPACSLPAIAHAADAAWNSAPAATDERRRRIERSVFGPSSVGILEALRPVSTIGDTLHTWPELVAPIRCEPGSKNDARTDPARLISDARAAADLLSALPDGNVDVSEWRLACDGSALLGEKWQAEHAFATQRRGWQGEMVRFAERLERFRERYESTWRKRYRPCRLPDISTAFTRLANDARRMTK